MTAKQSIRMLTKKGYKVFHNRLFSLGSNWIVKFKESVTLELYQATKRKVKMMCAEIAAEKTRVMKTEFPMSVLSGTITFFHDLGVRFLAKDYIVSPACNLCGKSVRNCPTGNICHFSKSIWKTTKCNHRKTGGVSRSTDG